MQDEDRLRLIRDIEQKRGTQVIAYVTSYRPGDWDGGAVRQPDIRIIERHLRALGLDKKGDLDLFLVTPGGLAIVPWALVTLVREYLGKRRFATLVPSMAMSAGTKICLGADEVLMGPGGYLGPVDTQMGFISVEDVEGYLNLAHQWSFFSPLARHKAFQRLSASVPPVLLGRVQRVRQEGKRVAMKLLESRRRPLSVRANHRISSYLLKQVGNHSQHIRRTEARTIGMSFVKDAESAGISDLMSELFSTYENLMGLDLPFAIDRFPEDVVDEHPTLEDFDVKGEHTMDRPDAIVESTARLDMGYFAYDYRYWRDRPERPEQPTPAWSQVPDDAEAAPKIPDLSGRHVSVHWTQVNKQSD